MRLARGPRHHAARPLRRLHPGLRSRCAPCSRSSLYDCAKNVYGRESLDRGRHANLGGGLTGLPIVQSGRVPSAFIERGVGEVVWHQAPAKPQLEATDAEIRATYKPVGADSRVPDLVFNHVEFADRESVNSAKGAPRAAMRSPSAAAFTPGLRGCRIERPQVTLQLACRLPHAHDHLRRERGTLFLQRVIRKRRPQGRRTRVRLRLYTFRKKPFVAKAAGCDLSTAQVLGHACVRHFWGRPELF